MHDTHTVPTARPAASNKRFRKVGTSGPGALVRVKMETVVTSREGQPDPETHEDAAPEDTEELFQEALQTGKAAGGRRRR